MMNRVHIYSMLILTLYACTKSNNQPVSTEGNKAIAISYIMDVVNNRKLELLDQLFSLEYVYHHSNGDTVSSMKDNSLHDFLEYLLRAFPDLKYEVVSVVSEGGIVAMNLTATGTHRGEFLGFVASGNDLKFREMFFFKIEHNKIVEGWSSVNFEEVKNQLEIK